MGYPVPPKLKKGDIHHILVFYDAGAVYDIICSDFEIKDNSLFIVKRDDTGKEIRAELIMLKDVERVSIQPYNTLDG